MNIKNWIKSNASFAKRTKTARAVRTASVNRAVNKLKKIRNSK
jgi:hypothetical protein